MIDADWRKRLKWRLLRDGQVWTVLAFTFVLCAGSGTVFLTSRGEPAPLPESSATASASPETAPAGSADPVAPGTGAAEPARAPLVEIVTEGEMRRGQTLASSLRANGVSGAVVHLIATEMAPVFDFRYSRPGDGYRLTQDEEGAVLEFRYSRSALQHYTIQRDGDDYRVARHEPELVRRRARLAGVVSTSLYQAVQALGEEVELANDLAEIFAWDIDFSRSVQPGDEFSILYERLFLVGEDGAESYVRPGRILAGRYTNGLHE